MGTASRRSRGLILIVALLALVLCTASPAAARPLKKGSKGPRVAFVQKVLGLHADRIYGSHTKRAVKRFQRRHGLTADGIVGPATWSALKRARGRASVGAHVGRGTVPAAPARARGRRRRRVRTRHLPRRQGAPAQPRPDGRRRGRPRHLGGARPQRAHEGAQAPPRGPRRAVGPPARRPARDRRRQPDRPHALQVRRRARELQRLRLRLLRLGLVTRCTAAGCSTCRWTPAS